jgi:hypothetical protein
LMGFCVEILVNLKNQAEVRYEPRRSVAN